MGTGAGYRSTSLPYSVNVLTSDPELVDERPTEGAPPTTNAPPPGPRSRRHGVARIVGAVGRLMMTSGVVILLLAAYQLWGTNLQTNRSQRELADEFDVLLDDAPGPTSTTSTTEVPTSASSTPTTSAGPPSTAPPQVAPTIAPPAHGQPIGRFSIPAIGVNDRYAVEGTDKAQLQRGAAHYPGTPLPGQAGNAAVAGHRTTYGAPLHNVDKLKAGDEIIWETLQGRFRYEVMEITIVEPTDVSVLEDKGDNRLTLTACHPKFSAAQRIIVSARLVGEPVPELEGQDEAADQALEVVAGEDGGDPNTIDVFATEPALRFPGAWWGALCMALWGLTRLLAHVGRRTGRFPRAIPYVIGTPVCLLVLYLFFESFSYEGFVRTIGV